MVGGGQLFGILNLSIITPHYRSVGRRQGSCAVFGGCLALSADLNKSNAFFTFLSQNKVHLESEKYIKRQYSNN